MLIWGFVLALHLLGVTAWVGGMLFALRVMHPSLQVLDKDQRLAVQMGVFERFFRIVWHSMPIVLLSGYAMLFGFYGGFTEVGWPIHIMHLTGLIMAGIFIMIVRGPWAALQRIPDPALAAGIGRMVRINLMLGLFTIIIACLGHFGP